MGRVGGQMPGVLKVAFPGLPCACETIPQSLVKQGSVQVMSAWGEGNKVWWGSQGALMKGGLGMSSPAEAKAGGEAPG